ncbi:MAG: CAP domain-containing protein [Bdellovibrionales bacterium]|nr:CAP domain-containing protein [Bdellovibrionales bacterium]NQZ18361.1 CAP domain-containing protein [Bdellovibrionales bacterium]
MRKGFVAAIAVSILFFCNLSLGNDVSIFSPKNLGEIVENVTGRTTFKNYKYFKRIKIKHFHRTESSMSFTALNRAVRISIDRDKKKVFLNGKRVANSKIRHGRVFFKHYGQNQESFLNRIQCLLIPKAHANMNNFFNQALNAILQGFLQGMMNSVNNGGLNSLFDLVLQNQGNASSETTSLQPFRPGQQQAPAVDPTNFFPESGQQEEPAANSAECPSGYTQSECEVVRLTNQARAQRGAGPLRIESHCTRQAEASTDLMARTRRVSHDAFNQATRQRLGINLGSAAGENVAGGQRSAREVVNDWLNSPGHARNIFDPNYTTIGISRQGNYWAQCFGRK